MTPRLLIYGATGYTGRLVLQEALARGLRPVLSGRSADAVRTLAGEHGLEARPAALDDPQALGAAFDGIGAVLHCAGPFAHTVRPMLATCIERRVHYLDITGEIAVFERVAAAGATAAARGITLLPGVGFDVVPTDCLAAHLKRRLPDATSLVLAFSGGSVASHGTALTALTGLGLGGAVRRGGVITRVPAAWRTRRVDFGDRGRLCVSIPWGDVSTAWHSTAIPEIVVYMATSVQTVRFLRLSRVIGPLLRSPVVQRFLRRQVERRPAGPSAETLARAQSRVWGEVTNAAGAVARARLTAPSGYRLTALTAVRAAERVLAGGVATGFQTPSMAFGPDFILEIDGVVREDVP